MSAGRDLDLAGEPVGAEQRAELGAENLDRDLAVVLEIVGQVDRGHAAAAELALEGVAAGQSRGEPGEVGRGCGRHAGKLQRDGAVYSGWRAALGRPAMA